MSDSCPEIVPFASVAVFWLPPESRKYLIILRRIRFESYSAHHFFTGGLAATKTSITSHFSSSKARSSSVDARSLAPVSIRN